MSTRTTRTAYAQSRSRGVTLLDTLVGTALMLVVFMGIAAAFRLSIEVVTNNKARAGAIALGNERMEYLRSLSYGQVGVTGGIPAGIVPQEETVPLNGVTYTRRTLVIYSDDPADGTGAADSNSIVADYKTLRVEVSWNSREGEREIALVGRMSPNGVETAVSGGTLTVRVVNAAAQPLANAQVDIANTGTSPAINIRTFTDAQGDVTFIGAPAASNYQVTVSRNGYSSAQTYPVTAQNPNPDPRHLTVANNQTTSATFVIDLLASKRIETYRRAEERTWTDTFTNENNIATSTNVVISGAQVRLAGEPPFPPEGTLRSVEIRPTFLAQWETFEWNDSNPNGTEVAYRIYDTSGASPVLIPDSALPGNSAGFTESPVNLSGLSTTTYPAIALSATLITSDTGATPAVTDWTLAYAYGPEPLPNVSFTMRGTKTIGNNPTVYAYDQTHATNASGVLDLPSLAWDTYELDLPSGSAYRIAESCAVQPEALVPGAAQTTRLFLAPASSNTLLVDVRTADGSMVQGASVALSKTGFNETEQSSLCGQVFFESLAAATYSIEVSKSGYQTYANAALSISGATRLSVVLASQ